MGGLYETGGRAWVVKSSQEEVKKYYNPKGWNIMKVAAKGKDVTVWVNAHKTAELVNDPGRTEGHLGLQLHGSQKMLVEFVKIEILEL